jgi:hypothetical protein
MLAFPFILIVFIVLKSVMDRWLINKAIPVLINAFTANDVFLSFYFYSINILCMHLTIELLNITGKIKHNCKEKLKNSTVRWRSQCPFNK